MRITKTKTTNYMIDGVGLGMFKKSVFFRVRKERRCWNCNGNLKSSEGETISMCSTDKGNKMICTPCAVAMATEGVHVAVDRTSAE